MPGLELKKHPCRDLSLNNIPAGDYSGGQAFNMAADCTWGGQPDLVTVLDDMFDDTPELSQPIGLSENEAVEHNTHHQRSAGRLFEQLVKLINQTVAIQLRGRATRDTFKRIVQIM